MQKHVGDQSPPFARNCVRPEIRSEMDSNLAREIKRAVGQNHRQKHGDIRPEDDLRQADRGLTAAPHPRRRHHPLGLIDNFATLRSLMLHAPLADLPSETQRRKLPPTLNTVRHVLIKRLTGVDEWCSIRDWFHLLVWQRKSPARSRGFRNSSAKTLGTLAKHFQC